MTTKTAEMVELPDTSPQSDPTPPATEYFEAEVPGKAGSVRVNLSLVERLAREIRGSAGTDGGQLGGILLGTARESERCTVIEDYQTVATGLDQERLYVSDEDRASLQRALTIWRSDPDGSIRAIGLFRTDNQKRPEATDGDVALLARHLPEPGSLLMVIGSERGETEEAAVYPTEAGRLPRSGGCVRFPWNSAELAGRSGAAGRPSVGRRRGRRLALVAALACLAGAALLAALLMADWMRQPLLSLGTRPKAPAAPVIEPQQHGVNVDAGATASAGVAASGTDAPQGDIVSPGSAVEPTPLSEPPTDVTRGRATAEAPPPPALAGNAAVLDADEASVQQGLVSLPAPAPVPAPDSQVILLPAPGATGAPRVGGQFEAPILIRRSQPAYPRMAREARVSGTVEVAATVGKKGQLREVRALSGPPLLQEAAVGAVEEWRAKPALLDGSPVEAEIIVQVVFRLEE
jgi:TonB family protein